MDPRESPAAAAGLAPAAPAMPDRAAIRAIAGRFLPSRWHYHYVRSKLASDPLYQGVADALREARGPLLDLGCGVGLLAHYLRAAGLGLPYHGVDNDHSKVALATRVGLQSGLSDTRFSALDLAAGFPAHCGSVAILDVLQFLPPQAQAPLLRQAAASVGPGGRLVIRTGLAGTSWRARITHAVDVLSRALRWMNTGPKAYPDRDGLERLLHEHGLQARFQPLWGGTPFNNWLVVAWPAPPQASGATPAGHSGSRVASGA